MRLLIVVFVVFFIALASAQAPSLRCGAYGPAYFVNIGTTLQTTAYFSAPLSGLSSGPYLFGCTPSQATLESSSDSITYAYYANSYLVSAARWYRSGTLYTSLDNTFTPFTIRYPRAISETTLSNARGFTNITMQYVEASNAHLATISVYSASALIQSMAPIFPFALRQLLEEEMAEEAEEEIELSADYSSLYAYAYNDPTLPYQATNVTRTSPRSVITINFVFTQSNGMISQIYMTTSTGINSTSHIYYNSNRQVTKICEISCQNFNYDSSGRLTSIQQNGQTLESYSFITNNGVSQIKSANLGETGKWTFKY